MEKQVLSIEQMQELIELGIDTSKASMVWIINRTKTAFLVPNEDNSSIMILLENEHIIDSYIPTFTLQDILTLLEPYHRLMVVRHVPNEWLDFAFKLLKFQYRNN